MRASEIIENCRWQSMDLCEYAINAEQSISGASREQVVSRFETMLEVMERAAYAALDTPIKSLSGVTGGDAYLYNQYKSGSILGEIPSQAIAYALSCSEMNAAMGKIVACPTAGSCGIVPAAILSVSQARSIPREMQVRALIVSGLIGMIIGEHASLSGAEGGCQAECGSASAMAAAAVVYMLGGEIEACFYAGAIAIKNILGLVCDPVAGLVEIPCIKRNAGGVISALACADIALSGVKSYIPFDDAVDAMKMVGDALPTSLKETAAGGLANTETGRLIKAGV